MKQGWCCEAYEPLVIDNLDVEIASDGLDAEDDGLDGADVEHHRHGESECLR